MILFFASLSIYFAYLALTRPKSSNVPADYLADAKPWGAECISVARKVDMPIFFELKGCDFVRSPKIGKILKKYYVQTELDPDAFPADYRALQRIFLKSGAVGEARVGILSSNGFPLYLANALVNDSNLQTNEDAAIIGALNAYVKNKTKVKSGVRVAIKVASTGYKISDYPTYFLNESSLAVLKNLKMIFASNDWSNVSAIFTENCRVAARIPQSNNSILAFEVKQMALDLLSAASKNDKLEGYQKLLIARALSEFIFADGSNVVKTRFFEILKELDASVDSSGFFISNKKAKTRDNALLLSLYARAYKISKNKNWLEKMKVLSGEIFLKTNSTYLYPALLYSADCDKKIHSQASAIDYTLLIRAWLDCYLVSKDSDYLKLALNSMDSLDVEFGDALFGDWFTNAQSSMFAEFFRYKDDADYKYPSAVGEGAQVLADLYSIKGEVSERLLKILSPYNSFFNYKLFDKSSWKLAMLANPMISSEKKDR